MGANVIERVCESTQMTQKMAEIAIIMVRRKRKKSKENSSENIIAKQC